MTAIPVTADAATPDSFSPAATAPRSACHHTSGSLSRAPASPRTTCGARPTASSRPLAASTKTALVDWVELSTPMTAVRGGMAPSFLCCGPVRRALPISVVRQTKYVTGPPSNSGSARGYAPEVARASLVMTVNK